MSNDLQDSIGRILWQDGQTLASGDLRAALQDAARHRRLHNRYLHQTWGITMGYGTQLEPIASRVILSPGHALDIEGNDLLLSETLFIDPPPDGTSILAASYHPSSCKPHEERALVAWVPDSLFNMGYQVPLARAVVAGGKITAFDLRVRRAARRMIRPHFGQGVTTAGKTGWVDQSAPKHPNLWLQVVVDTSEAGFVDTPHYMAVLLRQNPPRKNVRAGSLNDVASLFGHKPAFTLDGLGSVLKATSTAFTFRVPRGTLPFGVDLTASEAEAGGWVVSWLGMETAASNGLTLTFETVFSLLENLL